MLALFPTSPRGVRPRSIRLFHHTGMCHVLYKLMIIRVWLALCKTQTARRVHVRLYIEFVCMQTFVMSRGYVVYPHVNWNPLT